MRSIHSLNRKDGVRLDPDPTSGTIECVRFVVWTRKDGVRLNPDPTLGTIECV